LQGDLGGNLDNDHSQTSYFGTMVVILYAGAVQIKAVARALNAEIIACRGTPWASETGLKMKRVDQFRNWAKLRSLAEQLEQTR
jgi:hypothetical protein